MRKQLIAVCACLRVSAVKQHKPIGGLDMHRLKLGILLILSVAMILFSCASEEEKKAAHFEKGKAYFEKGDYKAAIIEFKNAIQIDPKYKEVYSHLGEAYLKVGDLRGAFRAYAILAELDPNNTEAQLKLSSFLMLGRQFTESREKIDAILSKEPNNTEALLMLAGLLGREDEAKAAAAEVLRIRPEFTIEMIYDHEFRDKADKERTIEVLQRAGLKLN